MGKITETKNGDLVILEKLSFTKESRSKKYRVYNVDDKKNGVIITVYIDPSLYDDFDGEEIAVKIKL